MNFRNRNGGELNERFTLSNWTISIPEVVTAQHVQKWIDDVRLLPRQLAEALSGASEQSLAKSYRENGWTVTQLVHHLADSHMNSFIRFKLALTEDTPTIKPYNEEHWAMLPDSDMPVATSYKLLEVYTNVGSIC
ncbi:hypothetical protein LSPH26S_01944 [Lysinibacillus sphaericus]